MRRRSRARKFERAAVYALAVLVAIPAAVTVAEAAWVKDVVHLQLRTGAGSQYRIVGRIKTGDTVQVLDRGDGWTQIRTSGGMDGWIPAGFLQAEPPAGIALERLQGDAGSLREEVARLNSENAELRTSNDALAAADSGQRSEIDHLTRENYELNAGARWPEWITGAGIVLLGMALGAILGRTSGRRRQQRIRL